MSSTDDRDDGEGAESDIKIKEEPTDDSMDVDSPPSLGPAALGLHPVGMKLPTKTTPTQPMQALNARGMPARIRKKNKLFFDEELLINDKIPPKGSPKKGGSGSVTSSPQKGLVTPSKSLNRSAQKKKLLSRYDQMKDSLKKRKEDPDEDSTMRVINPIALLDKKASQRIGLRLRNLLKLPKAHKFVSYEWFYSNIDRSLFDGENDFQMCLREMYPDLKTRFLTRAEWNKIRKTMGKPRRCSAAFFEEERRELERKRQKIRLLQTKRSGDVSFIRDLPKEIPQPLSVGTKVTARLRSPQDGLFTGTVEAIDVMSSAYRINFDRPGLGSHTIPDFEVVANDNPEKIALNAITRDFRPKYQNASFYVASPAVKNPITGIKGDPLLGGDSYPKIPGMSDSKMLFPKDNIGGFSVKLLELIVRTKKTLSAKQMKLLRLQNMNSEAEIYKSYADPFPEEFQKRYASLVVAMEKLNRNIHEQLNQLQVSCKSLTQDPGILAMISPSHLREQCREQADETFDKNNHGQLTNDGMIKLIKDLTTIMYVASNLGSNEGQTEHCLEVLKGCLEETKGRLDFDNMASFQRGVHQHIRHIQAGFAAAHRSKVEDANRKETLNQIDK
ncbi:protein lin-9 homolog [Topomyia yanbarensis]|uniref:protein lin-9 homolog n=1 Tax=Topomyia yanbarensis TaxID=2498891 RepID=UPI00273C4498|nr:protein lin-9 homolog [Topomyia yanbarensis]XP_058832906.1 protein lin-9 homolog [Topomyia yanbarensis]